MAFYDDFEIFKEDLFNTSDTNRGSIFRGILFLTLFASTCWNGYSLWKEMRSETWKRPTVTASAPFIDETFEGQKDALIDMMALRKHSARYGTARDRYIFNGLPDPTGIMQGTPLPKREELTDQERDLLSLYNSINPEEVISVTAIMHGKGANSALIEIREAGKTKIKTVNKGDVIRLASNINQSAKITSIEENMIFVKIKNAVWPIPILNIEEQRARDRLRREELRAHEEKMKDTRVRSVDPNATPEDRIKAHNEGISILRRRLQQFSSGERLGKPTPSRQIRVIQQ